MNKQRWQDWLNIALGLWILASPWVLQHVMAAAGTMAGEAPLGQVTQTVMWNMYIVGILVAITAGAALIAFQTWEEWTNIVLGAWLLFSPWILGFSSVTALMWNAVVAGAIVVVLASLAIGTARGREHSPL